MKLYSPKNIIIKMIKNIEDFQNLNEFKQLQSHRRFRVFHLKGTSCRCGLRANALVKWRPAKGLNQKPHWDLFYIDPNDNLKRPVLFTLDHIFPKSLGGTDAIENLQPMCYKCNHKKGNKIEDTTNSPTTAGRGIRNRFL